jgi:hypothetical protein
VYARKECHDSPWKLIAEDVVSVFADHFASFVAAHSQHWFSCSQAHCDVAADGTVIALLKKLDDKEKHARVVVWQLAITGTGTGVVLVC